LALELELTPLDCKLAIVIFQGFPHLSREAFFNALPDSRFYPLVIPGFQCLEKVV
jgi:hypothetical protein